MQFFSIIINDFKKLQTLYFRHEKLKNCCLGQLSPHLILVLYICIHKY